mmetsp:Transcript_25082/g.65720  ORF Transcript_25082/g.65720 Transcript_25082/m.65720 type:complete len:264 (-) Transcript_25082:32-823(-)
MKGEYPWKNRARDRVTSGAGVYSDSAAKRSRSLSAPGSASLPILTKRFRTRTKSKYDGTNISVFPTSAPAAVTLGSSESVNAANRASMAAAASVEAPGTRSKRCRTPAGTREIVGDGKEVVRSARPACERQCCRKSARKCGAMYWDVRMVWRKNRAWPSIKYSRMREKSVSRGLEGMVLRRERTVVRWSKFCMEKTSRPSATQSSMEERKSGDAPFALLLLFGTPDRGGFRGASPSLPSSESPASPSKRRRSPSGDATMISLL